LNKHHLDLIQVLKEFACVFVGKEREAEGEEKGRKGRSVCVCVCVKSATIIQITDGGLDLGDRSKVVTKSQFWI
jgi:hypothetical protein